MPDHVYKAINQFKGSDGSVWLHPDDPYAEAAMRAYIVAIDQTGEYVALVKQAKDRFTELFGDW